MRRFPPNPLSTRPFLLLGALLALAGCGSTPTDYQGLASKEELRPSKDAEKPYQYRSAAADLRSYTKLIIDPVAIYDAKDAQFGSVSAEDRKIIADYMQRKFGETLGKKFVLVSSPEADAARLHLTLTGIETSVPVLSTLSHMAPAGLVINTGLEATDNNGTFFGSVSYAVELSDAQTGNLLYAYVTKQTPDALDITASIGYLDAAKTGIRIGARHLLADMGAASPDQATASAAPVR